MKEDDLGGEGSRDRYLATAQDEHFLHVSSLLNLLTNNLDLSASFFGLSAPSAFGGWFVYPAFSQNTVSRDPHNNPLCKVLRHREVSNLPKANS